MAFPDAPSAELPCRHNCSITMVPVHPKYSGENLGMSGILEGSYNRKEVGIQHHVELDHSRPRSRRVFEVHACSQVGDLSNPNHPVIIIITYLSR